MGCNQSKLKNTTIKVEVENIRAKGWNSNVNVFLRKKMKDCLPFPRFRSRRVTELILAFIGDRTKVWGILQALSH